MKQLDLKPEAEAGTVSKMVASARKGFDVHARVRVLCIFFVVAL